MTQRPTNSASLTALQIVLAVAAAVQVFVVRGLLDGLLQLDDGATVGEIAPWLFAFVGIAALLTFSTTLRIERQRLMGELVARYTTGEVLDIAASADLLDYETPSFYNRLQRARIDAAARPTQMVGGLLTVGGSLDGDRCRRRCDRLRDALAPRADPAGLRPALVRYSSGSAGPSTALRSLRPSVIVAANISSMCSLGDRKLPSCRAFGHTDFVRAAYDSLYDARIADVRELVNRRSRLGLLGALGNAVLTGVVMLALVWMATTDRLSPADAGAVAGALLLIASRLSVLAGGSGSLYESALFMEDYTSFISTNRQANVSRRRCGRMRSTSPTSR